MVTSLPGWEGLFEHMRKQSDTCGEELDVLATGGTRHPPSEASRILELQKVHKALLRKNRKIEALKDRVRALENTVEMLRKNRVVTHTTIALPPGGVWA